MRPHMRAARVGVVVGAVHFAVTLVGAIVSVGAAMGATRPWAGSVFEHVVQVLTFVLLTPLSTLNWALPRHHAPGFPVSGVLLTSVAWGAAAFGIARWRQRRARSRSDGRLT